MNGNFPMPGRLQPGGCARRFLIVEMKPSFYKMCGVIAVLALVLTVDSAHAAGKGKKGGGTGGGSGSGLNVVNPVQEAGSDVVSTAFQNNILNDIRTLAAQDWSGLDTLGDNAIILDPSKIALVTDYDVRAYYVGEDTKFRNSIGFNTQAGGIDSGNPLLMFPDASDSLGGYQVVSDDNPGERSATEPLIPRDFVEMGKVQGGSDLNFFNILNGAKDPKAVYSSEGSLNPQQAPYMMAFAYTDGDSSYLVLGFEDTLGGGKKDFTDVVIALDIGDINIGALVASPEPATMMTLGSLIGLVGYARRRARLQKRESDDQSD